jgi:hypothetical protein
MGGGGAGGGSAGGGGVANAHVPNCTNICLLVRKFKDSLGTVPKNESSITKSGSEFNIFILAKYLVLTPHNQSSLDLISTALNGVASKKFGNILVLKSPTINGPPDNIRAGMAESLGAAVNDVHGSEDLPI